jgi:hypothetical protein
LRRDIRGLLIRRYALHLSLVSFTSQVASALAFISRSVSAGTSIVGHKTAQGLNDQATRVEFTGRVTGAEINQKAAIDSAKLQAISTIISRMGARLAQDIEKGMEMRY